MIAFIVALLLAVLGHGPMPAVAAPVPAAAAAALPHHGTQVGQSTSPHRAPARSAAPVVIPRDVPAPAPVAHPATVEPTDHERMSDNPCDVGETYNATTDLCDPS